MSDEEKEKTPSNHYIDNKVFFQAMSEWKKVVKEWDDAGDGVPPVTDYIGKCFLDIATHLSYRPNFINYPYREEMIGDGIENCLMYCKNFDPEKSTNPFSYFTQIIYYAFLRRIQKEKKQTYIKYKALREAIDHGMLPPGFRIFDPDDEQQNLAKLFDLTDTDLQKFEKKPKKKTKNEEPLETLFEETDENSYTE